MKHRAIGRNFVLLGVAIALLLWFKADALQPFTKAKGWFAAVFCLGIGLLAWFGDPPPTDQGRS